jgi:hypothetical protein
MGGSLPVPTALEMPRRNCTSQLQTHRIFREAAPYREASSCQAERNVVTASGRVQQQGTQSVQHQMQSNVESYLEARLVPPPYPRDSWRATKSEPTRPHCSSLQPGRNALRGRYWPLGDCHNQTRPPVRHLAHWQTATSVSCAR